MQAALATERSRRSERRAHRRAAAASRSRRVAAYRIDGPGGFSREERADERGQLTGIPAPLAGEYVISDGSAPSSASARACSRPPETSLAAVEQIEFNDQLTVAARTTAAKSDRSLWWALACAGFVVLLVEWWWFQRKPGVA